MTRLAADTGWISRRRSAETKDRLAEDMEFFDFGTIFFLVAAVVIFFQLRNVLGRRTGNERPPFDPYTAGRTATRMPPRKSENVVSLPRKRAAGEVDDEAYAPIDAFAKPGTDLNKGLRAIKDADPSFDPKTFVDGAKMAYEMIVMAYADGDRKTLKNLLSREVYDGFVAAIADREARSEKIQSSFVGIDKADIVSAEMKGGEAHVTLRIVSELISATRDERRRGDRRRSRNGGRGQGRLDLRPRHALEGSELEAGRDRSRRLIGDWSGRGSKPWRSLRFSGRYGSTSCPAGATTTSSAGLRGLPALGASSACQSPIGPARSASISTLSRQPMRRRARQRPPRTGASACLLRDAISCRSTYRPKTADSGFVTGFYEPEVEASPVRTERIHRAAAGASGRSGRYRRRQPAGRLRPLSRLRPRGREPGSVEYFDRPAIEQGALAGKGLEIAWLDDKVDVFFIHVQGAARLNMTDGTLRRVTYAAKSGHRFTGPGRVLAELGEIPLGRGDDAVDPRLVARAIPTASTKSSGRTAPTSSSARRRSTIRRLGRSRRRKCR